MTDRILLHNPGLVADWLDLGVVGAVKPESIERIAQTKSSEVLRLGRATSQGDDVLAKVTSPDLAAYERTVYEAALPGKELAAPRLFGVHVGAATATLFLEEIGGEIYRPGEHWHLAGEYLAKLHTGAPSASLPSRETTHYRELLDNSIATLQVRLEGEGLLPEESTKVLTLLNILRRVREGWSAITAIAEAPGPRFVHCDFLGKNLRVLATQQLVAFDWVVAARSTPCLDLAAAATPMSGYSIDLDPAAYLAHADVEWSDVEFDRQVATGKIFWNLMCVFGDIQGIGASWNRRAMKNLGTYEIEHHRALETLSL